MDNTTVLHSLLAGTIAHPEKVFFHQPIAGYWRTFTWAEVTQQAQCIAQGLRAQGFVRGDRIVIMSKNCAEWIMADFAIAMAGLVSVPIYATAGVNIIEHVIKHSGAKAIFVGKLDSLDAAKAAIPPSLLSISFPYPTVQCHGTWEKWLVAYAPIEGAYLPTSDDMATISYTSGTTSLPKGVVLSHKHFAAAADNIIDVFEIKSDHRSMCYLPLAHITERSLVAVFVRCQVEVYFTENLHTFVQDIQYASPTGFSSVPRLWSVFQAQIISQVGAHKLDKLLKLPIIGNLVAGKIRKKLGLHKARTFSSGAAPMSESVLAWYHKLGIAINEGWGMTETTGLASGNMPFKQEDLGTIGKPMPNVEMKLSADSEILIRGDLVFSKYYNDEAATRESFIDGWFKTGDLATLTSSGAYKITGRIKEQFKTAKGKYVMPVPIESLLFGNLNVEQACVLGAGQKQPAAMVVLNQSSSRKSETITQSLQATLEQVNTLLEPHQKLDFMMVCRDGWTVENDLLTATTKVKRSDVEHHYAWLFDEPRGEGVLWEEDLH
ncbi:MAG: long-chain acyl-CoA synthetase [Paraglaciecola sp.]|jgi:long-chain acyl-CoA synthetase